MNYYLSFKIFKNVKNFPHITTQFSTVSTIDCANTSNVFVKIVMKPVYQQAILIRFTRRQNI
jgi:hypothetical protein